MRPEVIRSRAPPLKRRHAERNRLFREIRLVHRANLRRLVLVLEHVATVVLAERRLPVVADAAEPAAKREMARRLFARREVMVVPALRRHEQAAALPIDPHDLAARLPHET